MSNVETYDAIVIGAGQAGGPLSTALAESGRRTALIEREHVGGTCINEGCTPTKTMVASARIAYLSRRATDYGLRVSNVSVDMQRVRQRKRAMVESFRAGSEKSLNAAKGLDLIMAEARFIGPKTIALSGRDGSSRELTAELIFINTGGRPAPLKIDGVDQIEVLDSTSIMELSELPGHLVVLGGGYIGVEFAQMFRRFGSRVTIVQHGPRLLNREDPEIADEVAKILTEDGIDLLFDSKAIGVVSDGDGFSLSVRGKSGEREVTGTHLLSAAGRVPNTDQLDPAAAGVKLDDKGYIPTNNRLETNVPGIYALGDVKGGPAFTHISYDDFRIIRANVIDGGDATIDDRLAPYVVYMDPQLGRVGLTETRARKQGRAIRIASLPMSSVARALEVDETRGLMKAVVDAKTDQILGCAIPGIEGGELMSMIQFAMMGKLPYTALRDGIFAHPTLAESFNNLFSSLSD